MEDRGIALGLRGDGGQDHGDRTSGGEHSPGTMPPPSPALPSWPLPFTCRQWVGWDVQETGPRGRAEAPWVYSGGFQLTPRAWRGPQHEEKHTQSSQQ